jgi:hypothetical protein
MKPEYAEEMKRLRLPWKYIPVAGYTDDTEAFITKAANEYHALKNAVEELRGLLSADVCPDCGGAGYTVRQSQGGEVEQEQCRWCWEKDRILEETEGLI